MLRVMVQEVLVAALLRGFERATFHGYCIEATRLSAAGADIAFIALTFTAGCGVELPDRVRIAVAFRSDTGSACRIDHCTSDGCVPCPDLSLAVSARVMPVTHRPKPVRSPENRWPQGSEISSVLQPSRGVPSPSWGWSLHFMCSMS
jgi:hypothetical protein